MPAPVIPILASVLAALGPWIMRFFAAKGALMLAGFMGRLGILWATNEYAIEPLIDHATDMWMSIPADWQCWLALFGATKVASIFVSGITLIGAKKLFFAKSD